MTVKVQLPDAVWARLLKQAEKRGVPVSHILAERLAPEMRNDGPDPVATRVRQLWSSGWADRDIGKELHLTNMQVADMRREMQLPANRAPRTFRRDE